MNRLVTFLFLFLVLFSLPFLATGQQKDVIIRIVQEETVVTPDHRQASITLQKKSFKIQVLLQHINGVYLFASLKDSLCSLPDITPVPGFDSLPEMTMAEENHNKEKELLVSDEGWSYWFYDPALPWHRFNKKITQLDSGRVVGSKTIKQLMFLPSRETKKLKENDAPLYLFFVAVGEEGPDGKPLKELLRRKIKIEWRDED
mgnify:CR=1 FL=1